MITNNFKAVMALVLQKCSTAYGTLPVKATNGTTYYASPNFGTSGFPGTLAQTQSRSNTTAGIQLGTGTTPATADDYMLQSIITATSVSCAVTNVPSVDEDGNPYLILTLAITNTGSSAVTISEIGYAQSIYAATALAGTSCSGRVCLIDRTVLAEPITIVGNGGQGYIAYKLMTQVAE